MREQGWLTPMSFIGQKYFGSRPQWLRHLGCIVAAVVVAGCGPALPVSGPIDLSWIRLPAGFRISLYAAELPGVRLMAFSPSGVLLVSLTGEGRIVALTGPEGAGRASHRYTLAEGLDRPHGLAFHGQDLHVAETGRVLRFPDAERALREGRSIEAAGAEVVRTTQSPNG